MFSFMRPAAGYNLHTLSNANAPVCIRCTACGHRGCADRDILEAMGNTSMHGNMTLLTSFRYVCTQCGGRAVELLVPHNRAAAVAWVNG